MQFLFGMFVIPYHCINFVQLLFMFKYWYICFAYWAVANFILLAPYIVILCVTDIVIKLSILRCVIPVVLSQILQGIICMYLHTYSVRNTTINRWYHYLIYITVQYTTCFGLKIGHHQVVGRTYGKTIY